MCVLNRVRYASDVVSPYWISLELQQQTTDTDSAAAAAAAASRISESVGVAAAGFDREAAACIAVGLF